MEQPSTSAPSASSTSLSTDGEIEDNEEFWAEVTLRLVPADLPISNVTVMGLPDLALAAPRALLLASTSLNFPELNRVYGQIVVDGLLGQEQSTKEDEKSDTKEKDSKVASPIVEAKTAFKFKGSDEEERKIFGRKLCPIDVVTYLFENKPIVTFVIVNTCVGRDASIIVSTKLVALLARAGARSVRLLSAVHFRRPKTHAEHKVQFLGLCNASLANIAIEFPQTIKTTTTTTTKTDQSTKTQTNETEKESGSENETVKQLTPLLEHMKIGEEVNDLFLGHTVLSLQVENIPTHCLLVRGYRYNPQSRDDGSLQTIEALLHVLEKLLPVKADLSLLEQLVPNQPHLLAPILVDTRMYS